MSSQRLGVEIVAQGEFRSNVCVLMPALDAVERTLGELHSQVAEDRHSELLFDEDRQVIFFDIHFPDLKRADVYSVVLQVFGGERNSVDEAVLNRSHFLCLAPGVSVPSSWTDEKPEPLMLDSGDADALKAAVGSILKTILA